jgi:hypothetical protein
MYRQRAAEPEPTGDQFVDRIYELPVVTSAIGKLGALYTGTKEHNRLFRFTLQTAESGLGLVVSTAKPVVAKFEKPIGSLNVIACQQLEKFEHDYPIITRPTDVVLKQTLETYNNAVKPITDRVRPITARVGMVTQYGVDTMHNVKNTTLDTIGGVANYGIATVNGVKVYGVNKIHAVTDMGSRQVNRLLDNQAGRALTERMDMAIKLADGYVDKYLPEDATDEVDKSPVSLMKKKLEVDEASDEKMLTARAMQLGRKVRHRTYIHMAKRLKMVKMRSLETVDKLNFTVDLMEYARTNLDGAKTKASYVWEEINKTPEEVSDGADSERNVKNMTYERRAIATARHLTYRLKAGLAGLHLSMDMVPNVVRTQINHASELAQSLYQTFTTKAKTGLTKDDVETVRYSLGNLRATLASMVAWLPFTTPASDKSSNSSEKDSISSSESDENCARNWNGPPPTAEKSFPKDQSLTESYTEKRDESDEDHDESRDESQNQCDDSRDDSRDNFDESHEQSD